MAEMLRSLHPEVEASHYVPVSLWDLFPDANPRRPKVAIPPLPDYSGLSGVKEQKRGKPCLDRVRAWLNDQPRGRQQAANDLGISLSAAATALWRLTQSGDAIRITTKAKGTRARATVTYVKARTK